MHKRIHALPEAVAGKIAAGEVVERPATVVKELVENAIDAGASRIDVTIEKGGKGLIRVTDDGMGIDADDLDLVFRRHATSKIATAEDLFRIETLGFRGEAMASISAVSRLELITRTEADSHGTSVKRTGAREVDRTPASSPRGTSVIVRDLFFNTPARLKFLKADKSEERKITDLLSQLALSHPDVRFKYTADGRTVFTTPGDDKVFNCIFSLYGKDVATKLMVIEAQEENVTVRGYVSTLALSRGNKKLQTFFVNGRTIENDQIDEALHTAYRGKLSAYRYPVVFLFFQVPPEAVDVNIHPAKTEIKFDERLDIKKVVYSAVLKTLKTHDQTPRVALLASKKESGPDSKPLGGAPTALSDPPGRRPQEEKKRAPLTEQPPEKKFKPTTPVKKGASDPPAADKPPPVDLSDLVVPDALFDAPLPEGEQLAVAERKLSGKTSAYDDLRLLGQLFSTYIVAERAGGLYLIDQHAAHEKINYEHLMDSYRKKAVASQMLFAPMVFHVSAMEYDRLMEEGPLFERLGLSVESFGHQQVAVRSVPVLFNRPANRAFVERMLESVAQKSAYEMAEDQIVQASCKHALRAKDVLDPLEIHDLIDQLKTLDDPHTCPHGRPIMIRIDKEEIEKKFKRT